MGMPCIPAVHLWAYNSLPHTHYNPEASANPIDSDPSVRILWGMYTRVMHAPHSGSMILTHQDMSRT